MIKFNYNLTINYNVKTKKILHDKHEIFVLAIDSIEDKKAAINLAVTIIQNQYKHINVIGFDLHNLDNKLVFKYEL